MNSPNFVKSLPLSKKILLWILAIIAGLIACGAMSFVLSSFCVMIAGDETGQIVTYDGENFTPGFYLFKLVTSFAVAAGIYFASWFAPMTTGEAARILFRIIRWIIAVAVVIVLYDCVLHIGGLRVESKFLPNGWWFMEAMSSLFAYLTIFLGGYLGFFLSKKIRMRKPYSMDLKIDALDADLDNHPD